MEFITLLQDSIRKHWAHTALSDYKGDDFTYAEIAVIIRHYHEMFRQKGIKRGDRISICGPNSARWGIAYLAAVTYGAVAVPILNDFMIEQVQNIVNHSESRLLFAGPNIRAKLDVQQIPQVLAVLPIEDICVLKDQSMQPDEVQYTPEDSPEALATLNYTSGTTGFSKGVMLPYRALWGNLNFCLKRLGNYVKPGASMLDILPMAHMYGLSIEFIFGFCNGCHLFFLNRLPSPTLIAKAFVEVKPKLVITVPLIIEKIIRKKVFPVIQTPRMRMLLSMPVISKKVKERICQQVYQAFGGEAYEVIVGGAALSKEVEHFLMSIGFPITVGYGATECAPLISYSDYHTFAAGSCGRAIDNMEVKILSSDPQNIPGEIVTRGVNVMLGYYK
ncbi:MAG: AMP-binding protein, partial [Bacteroidales bacterium]|nr:AMP-binding protein [Bacteroidales bacterium]